VVPGQVVAMTGTERDRYRTLTASGGPAGCRNRRCHQYQHVVALAIRYGQPALAAYLLPVSIDGLVAVSSLVMLRAARIGVSAPWLARTGLVLAVIATLACNVGYGVAHGWPGALLSGWPAVGFVVAAETAITQPGSTATLTGRPSCSPKIWPQGRFPEYGVSARR
jgi:Protein of unknown function (DUF2637)